jgi:hypothetical protein
MTDSQTKSTPPSTYTAEPFDSLPSIAEKLGHPGEWQALAAANSALVPELDPPLSDEAKAYAIAERVRPGAELTLPAEWVGPTSKPATPASDAAEAAEHLESHASSRRRDVM